MEAVQVRAVEAYCYRYPLAVPVVTSFGRMLDRPAVFVRIEDTDGVSGWGEVWCNFPSVGAEHRARLVTDVLGPALVGRRFDGPGALGAQLAADTSVLALQSGEQGPFAQSIAGLDTAAWDLFARRAGLPLWRMLGGSEATIRAYASGINPIGARQTVSRALMAGHRAFKLKIGFDPAADLANLGAIRQEIGGLFLAADANQAWSVETALERAPALAAYDLGWLEEPVRADVGWAEWRRIAEAGAPPLAGGENLAGEAAFAAALSEGVLSVVQPDLAKWGGLTLCGRVGRDVIAAGRRFCPHFLGGGIGLLASAHLLAAAGGDGMLEIDTNANPLRDAFCGPVSGLAEGHVTLGEEPGLGIEPDLAAFAEWRTL